MKAAAHIVPIAGPLQGQPAPGRPPVPALHPLTAELGRTAGEVLLQGLRGMFHSAGDQLLQMSETATTEADRQAHYDAMRVLAFERTRLLRAVPQELAHSLGSFAPPPRAGSARLALLPEQELEESILFARLSSRIKTRCKAELAAFEQRLEKLERDLALPPVARALAPRRLCELYGHCLEKLETGYRVRSLLLELFARMLQADAAALYRQLDAVAARHVPSALASVAAAESQRSDQLARVQRIVAFELASLINGRSLHPGARRFLCSAMAPLLSVRMLRYGAHGKLWDDALNRAAQLLRSLEPGRLEAEHEEERNEYLAAAADDLREIGFPEAQLEVLFAGLQQAYAGTAAQTPAGGAVPLH